MSVCQQRDISALCPSCPGHHRRGRGRFIGKVPVLYGQWHHGKSTIASFPGCAGRRLMHFIVKVPEKSLLAFHVVTMAVVPTCTIVVLKNADIMVMGLDVLLYFLCTAAGLPPVGEAECCSCK
ncbi:hypothetical protein AMECASPLE_026323 [Ameca splendens]|uniref:Uncharacterized protein n=1 Tax=Ameca splendens TaxID=208324 RepID=A0ABV0YSI4_9TELE